MNIRPYIRSMGIVLLFALFVPETGIAQKYLLRDDFNTTHKWWWYRNDGPVSPPQVKNGYVSANLVNPILSEYCNVELMHYQNIFQIGDTPMWMRMRVRGTTGKKPGSWGWGLWYTENPEPGKFYDMAWFMEQLDSQSGSLNTWWRAITGQKANSLIAFQDLPDVDNMEWHLYTIYLSKNAVRMWVDDSLVFETTTVIPQLPMAVHFWVDNHVRDYYGNKYRQSWEGENEFVMDFVEIRQGEVPVSAMSPDGFVHLYKFYNEIAYSPQKSLWKQETISVDSVRLFILATARVEQYPAYSDPDALELVLSTPGDTIGRIQMNANREDNLPQTVLEQLDVPAGTYNLDLFAHITPTLYGVAAVGSKNATVLVADTTMETAPGGDSLTWKTYSFTTSGGRVAFYISGSADEDPQSNDYGSFDEGNDDDLYLQLNDQMLNDSLAYFLDGNRLLGEGKTIFFVREMAEGTHTLSLITNNTPTKNAVIIIGEQGGEPVSLGHRIQQIPQQFRLKVFPNPFNQDVHLYFTSRSIRQPISVQIVNVNGQPVRKFQVLPQESVTDVRWDGTDNRGNVLPSGIYFVRATQGSYSAMQKLVLIR